MFDDLAAEGRIFSLLVQAIEDYAIFRLDKDGVIQTWNPGAERMKMYTADEVIGRHFSMLYPEEGRRRDEPMKHLRVAMRGHYRGEGVRLRKNGELFLADVLIIPIRNSDGDVTFCKFVQDITERDALMQERDISRAEIARLEAEAVYREQFAAMLTHDLRSPLTSVAFAAELMERAAGDPQRVRELAVMMRRGLARVDKMIGDMLDVARLDAGGSLALSLTLAPCDLRVILEEMREEHARLRRARLDVTCIGDVRGQWSADALRRVLDNLVSNAEKYGAPDAPVAIFCERREEHVLLDVHNEGPSISAEDQLSLFAPFRRTQSAERTGKAGWGIGLTLVRGIVEAHGGIIKVSSFPDEGTTFSIDLPVRRGEQPLAAPPLP